MRGKEIFIERERERKTERKKNIYYFIGKNFGVSIDLI